MNNVKTPIVIKETVIDEREFSLRLECFIRDLEGDRQMRTGCSVKQALEI